MDNIMKNRFKRIVYIFQTNRQVVSFCFTFQNPIPEIPDSVRKFQLYGCLFIAHTAIRRALFHLFIQIRMKALLALHRIRIKILDPANPLSPVQMHQNPVIIFKKGIRRMRCVQHI